MSTDLNYEIKQICEKKLRKRVIMRKRENMRKSVSKCSMRVSNVIKASVSQ